MDEKLRLKDSEGVCRKLSGASKSRTIRTIKKSWIWGTLKRNKAYSDTIINILISMIFFKLIIFHIWILLFMECYWHVLEDTVHKKRFEYVKFEFFYQKSIKSFNDTTVI